MRGLGRWVRVAAFSCAITGVACSIERVTFSRGDSPPTDGPPADAGGALVPPSCKGLPKTCGANGDDDCCASLPVPGGTYYRSYDVAGDALSGSQEFPATVSSFRLDKYEVTVARFRAFVDAGMGVQSSPPQAGAGAHPAIVGSGWNPAWTRLLALDRATLVAEVKCDSELQMWTDARGANETRPMNCVALFQAIAFCTWDGGFLPTEAEWNYAAAGGNEQRVYPWSAPPTATELSLTHASYFDGTDCVGDGRPGCEQSDIIEVGRRPRGDGKWGQSDLAGNLAEWTLDSSRPYETPCNDCSLLPGAMRQSVRGGSHRTGSTSLRSGTRDYNFNVSAVNYIGVRCARPI